MIPTVLGPVQAVSVTGSCSPREHLLNKPSPADLKAFHDNPITLARLAEFRSGKVSGGGATELDTASNKLFSLDECVQELASLKGVGSGLVLECSRQAEGRYPSGLAEISERSGMHIVMAASWRRVRAVGLVVAGGGCVHSNQVKSRTRRGDSFRLLDRCMLSPRMTCTRNIVLRSIGVSFVWRMKEVRCHTVHCSAIATAVETFCKSDRSERHTAAVHQQAQMNDVVHVS